MGGSLVVVEGKRDQAALRSIGFSEYSVVYNNFRGTSDLGCHLTAKNRKIILLLDMDRKGKVLTSKILYHLNSSSRHDYLQAKCKLAQITKGRLRDIEDLKISSKDPQILLLNQ